MDNSYIAFFKAIFGGNQGYICIATILAGTEGKRDEKDFGESFFIWPDREGKIGEFVNGVRETHNVYFCPHLLDAPKRTKKHVKLAPALWADLDECEPTAVDPPPSIAIESSPDRFQALWFLEGGMAALDAEEMSRRLAYTYADKGVDRSGWDLSQLLRLPNTYNFKYSEPVPVRLIKLTRATYRDSDFEHLVELTPRDGAGIPFPTDGDFGDLAEQKPAEILQKYRRKLNPEAFGLFSQIPEEGEFAEGWSGALWKLLMLMFEADMSREEIFLVASEAACNKYVRDRRSPDALWSDVCRAYVKHQEDIKTVVIPEFHKVELVSDEEVRAVRGRNTFLERYIAWATSLGDAAPQYHQAGGLVILSALLAGRVVLPTSYGNMVPNLWFMILADTTLTRKSTAMDIAMDLLVEVDSDTIMATDGSIEGLLQGLSMRPGRPSIFLRDEFSGLLDTMSRKDYMAGMAELLTKLYDGKMQKRILRKEIVEVRDPVLILFAGGIRSRIQQLLTLEHISSGFMPRFVFLTAESDTSRVKPLGPPVSRDMSARNSLLAEMADMYDHYTQELPASSRGVRLNQQQRRWNARLTSDAWGRFNEFEKQLLEAGVASEHPEILTPVYDRLGKSTLKAATLLAAANSRQEIIEVGEADIVHAISYAASWREYAIDIINGVGKTASETQIERMMTWLRKQNQGAARSSIMQRFHLMAREASALLDTMDQRGLVRANRVGGATVYHAVKKD